METEYEEQESVSLIPQDYHKSWEPFLTPERIAELESIARVIKGQPINPSFSQVLRFLRLDLNSIRVVILGQDPYPKPGVATGRAFQIEGLNDWLSPFRQTSFRNILRLIYKTYQGIESYDEIPSFLTIKEEIREGRFRIKPPYELMNDWEKQGVLLLNATFSCLQGKPLSHKTLWSHFTESLLSFIVSYSPSIRWFLWGKEAQLFVPFLSGGKLYLSRHPMMCSSTYEDDFLKSNCFRDMMQEIDWRGLF